MAQIRNDVKSHKRLSSKDMDKTPIREGPEYDPGMDSVDSDTGGIRPIDYGDDTESVPDAEQDPTDTLDLYNISMESTRGTTTQNGTQDVDNDLAHDLGDMSLDSTSLMEQFPPLPIALIVSSSSSSSHVSIQRPTSPGGSGGSKPNYLSPHGGGFPLAHPSTSARANMNPDDLNRFVSSSTASGATITSGTTTASIVKHEGRPIKLITPESQMIPQRIGEMMFDPYLKKWVKAGVFGKNSEVGGVSARTNGSNDSEDPFHDIESLQDDGPAVVMECDVVEPVPSSNPHPVDPEVAQRQDVSTDTESDDAEEAELTSFSFDSHSLQAPVQSLPTHALETEPEGIAHIQRNSDDAGQTAKPSVESERLDASMEIVSQSHQVASTHQSAPTLSDAPPLRLVSPTGKPSGSVPPSSHTSSTLTPAIPTSCQKSASVTPVSALKDPKRGRLHTPANKLTKKRSVSFSDGKREGPIIGVGRNAPTPDETTSGDDTGSISDIVSGGPSGTSLEPSARSKRIAGMLEDLEDTCESFVSINGTNSCMLLLCRQC